MKKMFNAAILLLCLSSIFFACEKTETDKISLDGIEWTVEKIEAYFDGKVVNNLSVYDENRWGFDGSSTIRTVYYSDPYGIWRDEGLRLQGSVYGRFSDNLDTLVCGHAFYKVVKLSDKELVLDLLPENTFGRTFESYLFDVSWYEHETPRPIATFNGRSIFARDISPSEDDPHWYHNDSGLPIQCDYNQRMNPRKEVWDDDYWITLFDYDYWFDSIRFYLKSQ